MSIARRLLMTCAVALALAAPSFAKPIVPMGKPVDLVLCLDVSSSMDGLIDSAKLKLWDIVNDLAKIKPTPVFRVALYSYGHTNYTPESGWVRRELELTNDLDEVYKRLTALRTSGGDEYVARVTKTALDDLRWTTDPDALRILFVCGNESAEQDTKFSLETVAKMARKQNVFINTIHCAPADSGDDAGWKRFAKLGGGKGLNIDQGRNLTERAINAPQDETLRKLSAKLNGTYLGYGADRAEKAQNQAIQDLSAEKAAPQAAASRAVSKGSGLYRNDAWDLCDRLKNDPKFKLSDLKEAELPDDVKKLPADKREGYVREKLKERDGIQKEIAELAQKRDAYIREERKKLPKDEATKAFDEVIRGVLKEQAASCGMVIPE